MKKTIKSLYRILLLWLKPSEWKQHRELLNQIKKMDELRGKKITDRTIMRYLRDLYHDEQLEKKVDMNRNTWYRPDMTEYSRARIHEFANTAKPRITINSVEVIDFINLEGIGGMDRIHEVIHQFNEGKEPWTKKKGEK